MSDRPNGEQLALQPLIDYLGHDHPVLIAPKRREDPHRPVSLHRPLTHSANIPACGVGGGGQMASFDRMMIAEAVDKIRAEGSGVRPCGSCWGNHDGACGDTPRFPTKAEYNGGVSEATRGVGD